MQNIAKISQRCKGPPKNARVAICPEDAKIARLSQRCQPTNSPYDAKVARQTQLPDVAKFLKDASVARLPERRWTRTKGLITKDANVARSPKDVKVARGSQRKDTR